MVENATLYVNIGVDKAKNRPSKVELGPAWSCAARSEFLVVYLNSGEPETRERSVFGCAECFPEAVLQAQKQCSDPAKAASYDALLVRVKDTIEKY